MDLFVRNIKTDKGVVQGCQLKWTNSWLFIIDAPKGNIVCGSIDIKAFDKIGIPAAQIVPEPGESAYSVEEFIERKITNTNENAKKFGIKIGMSVYDAIDLLY